MSRNPLLIIHKATILSSNYNIRTNSLRYLFGILLCFITGVANAQQCKNTVTGYIIDLHDQTPLVNATIIVAGSEIPAVSNDKGFYSIPGLCEATYTLQVSHPECTTQAIRVVVRGDTERTINMEHHLEELGEISISGTKSNSSTGQEQEVNDEALRQNAAASLGDALATLSGVSSLNTGNTIVKPVIQGLHSSRVVLVTDGSRLQDQEWGVEHAPTVDINNTGSVTVVKGASALQYGGDAIGGTIILKPAHIPQADSLYGSTTLTGATNGRGGGLTTKITKSYNSGWYGSLQGTIKRFGDFEAPDYVLSNTAIFERNIAGRVGINTYAYGVEASYSIYANDLGILRSSHVGNAADLATAINSNQPFVVNDFTYTIDDPKQEIVHQTAKISAFKRYEDLGKLKFQYDFQKNNRLEFDIRRDSEDTRPSIDLELTTHTAALDFDYTADNSVVAKVGVLGRSQTNFPDPDTGVRRLIPDYDRIDLGPYAIGGKTINKWTLEGGLRYDYNHIDALKFYRRSFWESRGYDEEFGDLVVEDFGVQLLVQRILNFHNVSTTAGVNYDFNDIYSISSNYAFSNRAPNPSELFSDGLHQSAARIELGDLRFEKETSQKVGVTLSRKHKNWSFSLAPFANYINNFLLIEPTGSIQTIRGNFPIWEYRQTDARLLGIDIDNSIALTKHFSLTNQLSVVKGRDRKRQLPLINIPPVSTRNRISYSNDKWHHFSFWVESQYVFEQNEFPDTNFDIFVPSLNEDVLVDVSTPPPAYHLINLRGQLELSLFSENDLELALGVQNVFNTSYRDYLNRQRFFADDQGRNVLMQVTLNY